LIERVTEPASIKLVLIDLTLKTVDLAIEIPLLKQAFPGSKVLAFGPHVDVERLQAAEDAGSDVVLTRGQMDRDLVSILAGA
jgi:DNA-binding NarL/FixJ family response regulator